MALSWTRPCLDQCGPSSTNFAHKFKGKYLTSNVDIAVADKHNKAISSVGDQRHTDSNGPGWAVTLHASLPFYTSLAFIASDPPQVPNETETDLVFVDCIEQQLLGVINTLQSSKNLLQRMCSHTPCTCCTGFWAYMYAWNTNRTA
jgi:hypothetical protein